jgi:AraC family transcriptional regulator
MTVEICRDERLELDRGEARQAVLLQSDALRVRLVFYSAGAVVGLHSHARWYFSVALLGRMFETRPDGEIELLAPFASLVPPGMPHANQYGPAGFLCLVFDFDGPCVPGQQGVDLTEMCRRKLRRIDDASHIALVEQAFRNTGPDVLESWAPLLGELLAAPARTKEMAPAWLGPVRDRIEDSRAPVRVQDLADRAGVHRVHLARAFSQAYGRSPKAYQLDTMCLHALNGSILQGESLTHAAWESGFCDPSHAAREMSKRTGLNPAKLQAWLRS